jgi:mRNA interferase RelE/StbE
VADRARKQLAQLDRVAASRILAFLRTKVAAAEDPRRSGEALKGSRFGELWRYRVGDDRVIARIDDGALIVLVVQIGRRREVYR